MVRLLPLRDSPDLCLCLALSLLDAGPYGRRRGFIEGNHRKRCYMLSLIARAVRTADGVLANIRTAQGIVVNDTDDDRRVRINRLRGALRSVFGKHAGPFARR